MFASTVNLLFAHTGSRGIELLKTLMEVTHESNLMSRLVETQREVARNWIRTRPNHIDVLPVLSEVDLDVMYGDKTVKNISEKLGVQPMEVVRLLNGTLYRGAHLVAPDGEDVSERAAKKLDADLKIAVS